MPRVSRFPLEGQTWMYTPEEIFTLPWKDYEDYTEFALPKVHLVYRIRLEKARQAKPYRIMVRYKNEPPYLLGYAANKREAQYRIFSQILVFRLYVTGKWETQERPPPSLYERWKRSLYQLYPSDFLDKIDFDSYHGVKRKGKP